MYLRVERSVDELVGQIGLLRALHDGHRIDAHHRTFTRDDDLDRHALIKLVEGVHRQHDLDGRLARGKELVARRVAAVVGLHIRLESKELVLSDLPVGRATALQDRSDGKISTGRNPEQSCLRIPASINPHVSNLVPSGSMSVR